MAGVRDVASVPEGAALQKYNLCPTNYLVCVLDDGIGLERSVRLMKWGLEPRFVPTQSLSTINARIEGVLTSKVYGPLINEQRCVVIVDGFYEWHQAKNEKIPYLMQFGSDVIEHPILRQGLSSKAETSPEHARVDESSASCVLPVGVSPLLLAGIYDFSKTTLEYTCSILTTEACGPVSKVHSRMPVFLSPESARNWLSQEPFEGVVGSIIRTSRELAGKLVCKQVSSLVNSISNKSIEVTYPASEMKKRSFEQGLGRFFSPTSAEEKKMKLSPG